MESVVRNVIEPMVESILKKLNDLDKKIILLDTKITKIENDIKQEFLILGCNIDSRIPINNSNISKMENID